MENRIKEQQLCLFADRTRAATMRANELRLWFSSVAYCLLVALRQRGLAATELARARCDTIRLKLLKIGALVRVTVRRVWVSLADSYPYQALFARVHQTLRSLGPVPGRGYPPAESVSVTSTAGKARGSESAYPLQAIFLPRKSSRWRYWLLRSRPRG